MKILKKETVKDNTMSDNLKKFDLDKIRANTINHDDYMHEKLQDSEYQKGWLKISIMDYIETGDYSEFYRALEQVIKARGTIKEFAEKTGIDRSNLTEILKCKTKSSPSISTIGKILKGLGYTLSVDDLKLA